MKPISREILIKKLKRIGFLGPYHGSKHDYMIFGEKKIIIPNVHSGKEIGEPLLSIIIRQLGLSKKDFTQND